MAADDDFRKAARDAMAKLGEAATYRVGGAGAGTAITAKLDKGVQLVGDDSTYRRQDVVTVLVENVADPKPGDTIQFGATVYRVDKRLRNDGYYADLAVKT